MIKIHQIIERFFKDDHPEDIRKNFVHWFFSPFSSKDKEEALHRLWDDLQIKSTSSAEQSLLEVERRLGFPQRKRIHFSFHKYGQMAALFLVPLLSAWMSWVYVQNRPAEELALIECFVPDGETRTVVLPDHSEVTINSGSSLFYPVDFKGNVRDVYLSGEARFSVFSDKKKPFIVKTNEMSIEALGTVFNVSSYPAGDKTIASLAEGKIRVDIKSSQESFILDPDEQIVYDRKTGKSERRGVRIDYVLAWEKGQMVFQSASLYSVISAIERHYKVTIYLNSRDLSDEKLTVKFLHNETLDEVLYTLQQIVARFKYKIDGDKVYIY